jgi:hypothetical protein
MDKSPSVFARLFFREAKWSSSGMTGIAAYIGGGRVDAQWDLARLDEPAKDRQVDRQ